MGKKRDLTGQKWGKLTVLREHGRNSEGKVTWLCRCECGNEKVITGVKLTAKIEPTITCTCCAGPRKHWGFFLRHLFHQYKMNARRRGIEWTLFDVKAKELFEGNCFYCGAAPSERIVDGKLGLANGIDRLDSQKGYTKDNCVSCCSDCNYFKATRSYKDFIGHIERIYKHLSGDAP